MSPGYLSVNPYYSTEPRENKATEEDRADSPNLATDKSEEAKKSAERVKSKNNKEDSRKADSKDKENDKSGDPLKKVQNDVEMRAQIAQLKRIETEVIAHEAAHMAVGGKFAGAATYSRTQGPDGNSYITGGEVSISVPASDDLEETIRNMDQVRAAALAPGKPSSQDLSVAAAASAQQAAAQAELAGKPKKADNSGTGKTEEENSIGEEGLTPWAEPKETTELTQSEKNEGIQSASQKHGASSISEPSVTPLAAKEAKDSYEKNMSPNGLWTSDNGYERDTESASSRKMREEFFLAA